MDWSLNSAFAGVLLAVAALAILARIAVTLSDIALSLATIARSIAAETGRKSPDTANSPVRAAVDRVIDAQRPDLTEIAAVIAIANRHAMEREGDVA